MGCLVLESFDGIGGGWAAKILDSGGMTSADIVTGRHGNGADISSTESLEWAVAPTTADKGVIGFAFKASNVTSVPLVRIWDGQSANTPVFVLGLNASGQISVDVGGTTVASGSEALTSNAWYHVAMKFTIANSGGNIKVRINGSETDAIDYTGDTQALTNTGWDRIAMSNANAAVVIYDDLFVFDQSATAPNDFVGDVRVQWLSPNGDGAYSQWVRSTGATDYTLLDDTDPDEDLTDYVSSSTVGSTITVTLDNLAGGTTTVYAAQLLAAVDKTDAGAREVTGAFYIGSTLYTDSSPKAPSDGSVTYGRWVYNVSPATSTTWTTSEIDSIQIGVKVTT